MRHHKPQIEMHFEACEVDFVELPAAELEGVVERWLKVFASNVKRQTGSWVCNNLMWEGFSKKLENAIEGQSALNKYANNWPAEYFVFDEETVWGLRCKSKMYPDLTCFGADIYVSHHNMKWTMAFTHEQPWHGPFFSEGKLAGK